MPSVDDGRQMFDDARKRSTKAATTRTAVGRGHLGYIATAPATRNKDEGRQARATLAAHFAKSKNDDGSEFAEEYGAGGEG